MNCSDNIRYPVNLCVGDAVNRCDVFGYVINCCDGDGDLMNCCDFVGDPVNLCDVVDLMNCSDDFGNLMNYFDLRGFIEIPTRCILFIYLSALHVSGYAHLQELQMYFANRRCVY